MQAPLQAGNDSDAIETKTARTDTQERQLVDNRQTAVAPRELTEMMNNSPRLLQPRALSDAIRNSPLMAVQRQETNALFGGAGRPQRDGAMSAELWPAQREEKPNNTGLPNQLKSGIESLSGMSMDHVKVHYNSAKPAQLQARAYAQGSEIHLAAGQERHLPHEAWHIVQQAQDRVRPTLQMKAVAVNDDPSLEKEADMMGEQAAQFEVERDAWNPVAEERVAGLVTQHVGAFFQPAQNVAQRVIDAFYVANSTRLPKESIGFSQAFREKHFADDENKAIVATVKRVDSGEPATMVAGEIGNTTATSAAWLDSVDNSTTVVIDGKWTGNIDVLINGWETVHNFPHYTTRVLNQAKRTVGGTIIKKGGTLTIDHVGDPIQRRKTMIGSSG